jgi:DNA modification methylase
MSGGESHWTIRVGDCLDTLRAMPDASVDAVVTDPPYGLGREPDPREVLAAWLDGAEYQPGGAGFMGKAWDAFVPSPCVWSECLRVLKPGGHLLAFAGSRTYDWIVLGVRLAGFEVRDQLLWLYATGFPKSLNVSKAIDRQRHDRDEVYRVTAWIRSARDAAGVTNRQIDDAFECNGMARHWTDVPPHGKQPSVPTLDQIPPLLDVLGLTLDDVPDDVRRLIWTLNGRKGQPGAAWYEREVIGSGRSAIANPDEKNRHTVGASASVEYDITAPATEAARQWDGWGTALKPAHEPIVLARKPLSGTVAHNVTTHGTGAINVDGCRVGDDSGRWPANVLHDGSPEVVAGFPVTSSATLRSGKGGQDPAARQWGFLRTMDRQPTQHGGYADTGTAARFFYSAKASRAERERGLTHREPETVGDGRETPIDNAYQRGKTQRRNVHPTVKPVAVMRWLVRLVTPPGGVVLDPFTGSGTTGIAATLEGFRFIGCELSPEYAEIARARITHATAHPHEWDPDVDPPADDTPSDDAEPGQTSLLDLV